MRIARVRPIRQINGPVQIPRLEHRNFDEATLPNDDLPTRPLLQALPPCAKEGEIARCRADGQPARALLLHAPARELDLRDAFLPEPRGVGVLRQNTRLTADILGGGAGDEKLFVACGRDTKQGVEAIFQARVIVCGLSTEAHVALKAAVEHISEIVDRADGQNVVV